MCRLVFSNCDWKVPPSKSWIEFIEKIEKINNIEVDCVYKRVFEDEEALRKKVVLELKSLYGKEHELACFLLERLERLKSTSNIFL